MRQNKALQRWAEMVNDWKQALTFPESFSQRSGFNLKREIKVSIKPCFGISNHSEGTLGFKQHKL